MTVWPSSQSALIDVQQALGRATPPPWSRPDRTIRVGACYACFTDGGPSRQHAVTGWAAAVITQGRRLLDAASRCRLVAAPYLPGLLALRSGPLLEDTVRALAVPPDVLLVNATGRDHPRRAGLALHLGSVLGLPTVGVTDRPLRAEGAWPADAFGAVAPLRLGGELVGYWVRTRPGTKPVAVHAAWRTSPDDAVEVVLSATRRARTPHPLRRARQRARLARSHPADPPPSHVGAGPCAPPPAGAGTG
jgi:deoxyribonuclease V